MTTKKRIKNKKETTNIVKGQKINKKSKINKNKKEPLINIIKNKITKKHIFYLILLILDIAIIIYSARHNYANYVSVDGSTPTFIGDTKDLFFGKNYITIITTAFFFGYTCLTNKFLFQEKNSKKFIFTLLVFLLILNLLLFFIFTKRVY